MTRPKYLELLTVLFITTLLISNIIAVKIGSFGGYFLPVAVIIFPLSYIIADVLTEVYGYAVMRHVIWLGFFCNFASVLIIAAARAIPPAPFFTGNEAFDQILGATPRIFVASLTAYLFGSFLNSFVLAKLKVVTKGRYLWLRTITSTIVGEGIDSFIFISMAFYGVFPEQQILSLIVMQWSFKCAVEIVLTPLTYLVTGALKKTEKIDYYDTKTNFSPLKFFHAN